MPVFNGLPLIKASIESLYLQSYSNWECIIVDDGSTDGTSQFLDTIDDKHFVIWHLAVNSGRAVARQKALDLCRGKYICMLDAEDLYHPNKIALQVDFLENNPNYSLCTTALCSFGTKTDMLLVRGATKSGDVVFSRNNHPVHAPSMYRASIAKSCKYSSYLHLGEDQDFLEKYLKYNPLYYVFSDVLYYYSELDSVSKHKISKNYYLYILKYFRDKNYSQSFVYLLKFIYSKFIFPFKSIESILYSRGRKVTQIERQEFNLYCKNLVDKVISE